MGETLEDGGLDVVDVLSTPLVVVPVLAGLGVKNGDLLSEIGVLTAKVLVSDLSDAAHCVLPSQKSIWASTSPLVVSIPVTRSQPLAAVVVRFQKPLVSSPAPGVR